MAEEPPAPTPPRHRLRRWLARALLWSAAVLALLAGGAALLVDSPLVRERLRALLQEELRQRLGREVTVGAVDVDPLALSVEAEDLVLPGPEPGAPPVLTVPRARVALAVEGWRPLAIAVRQVEVSAPRAYLELRPDGSHNLPTWRGGGGEGKTQVSLGAVILSGGELRVNHRRLPLDLAARDVRVRLTGPAEAVDPQRLELSGQVVAQEVEITLPEARAPYPLTLTANGRFERGGVRLDSVLARGPHLRADLAGALRWGEEETPRLELDVETTVAAAALERVGWLEEGRVEGRVGSRGELRWQGETWSYQGSLASPRLALADLVLEDVAGTVGAGPEAVAVVVDRALYAGGAASGRVDVTLGVSPVPFAAAITLADLRLARLIAERDLPLRGVTGEVGGAIHYRATSAAPLDGEGWADLKVKRVERPGQRLSLSGTVPLLIQRGVLSAEAIRLEAPSQRLEAALVYDLEHGRGHIDYEIDSSRLEELAALLELEEEGAAPTPWLPTGGRGHLSGQLRLAPEGAAVDARFDLAPVETPGLDAETLRGSLTFAERRVRDLRLEAQRGDSALMLTGEIDLGRERDAEPGASPTLRLNLDTVGWPLDRLGVWIPVEPPLGGAFTGRLELAGAAETLGGHLAGRADPAVIAGMEGLALEVEADFDAERFLFQAVDLETAAGTVSVLGTVGREDGRLDLDLAAPQLDLGRDPLSRWLGGNLGGALEASGWLEGTLEEPRLALNLAAHGLTLGGRALGEGGEAELDLDWSGGELTASGSLLGLMEIEGGGTLPGLAPASGAEPASPAAADLTFHLGSDALGDLVHIALDRRLPEVSGSFRGALRVAGELAAPTLRLELADLKARYGDHLLTNLEPVVVRLAEGDLVIDSLYLGDAPALSEVFVSGRVGLSGELPLDLRLQSTLAASWLELAAPDLEFKGEINALGRVRGTAAEPRLDGQADLREGRVLVPQLSDSITRLDTLVLFYPGRLVLDHLDGRLGGGGLRASGAFDLPGGDRGAAASYRLQINGRDVRLRWGREWALKGDADLSVVSDDDGRLIRGIVTLEQARYLQNVDLGLVQILQGFLRRERAQVTSTDELLTTTRLNVLVEGPGALRVRNDLADLTGSLQLNVRGTLAAPSVLGRVELEPGSTLVYADNKYEVVRGLLTFANPYRLDPVIDLLARAEVRSYQVTLNLSGTLERLETDFRSEPPLPQLDILSLVAGGDVPAAGAAAPADDERRINAEQLLLGQAASAISERVNTLFGLDKFRIDPIATSGGGTSAVRVTVGKRFSKDLFVTYSSDASGAGEDILQAEWQVSPKIVLIFTRNSEDGTFAVDAQWSEVF